MLSEKTYWIILIIAFTGFALSIWFWLIPQKIIEYNLGVNLFTSSIFMVFTVVFLTWLFTLRERIQWTTVKNEVYGSIQDNLSAIFDGILDIVEEGVRFKQSILSTKDTETRKKLSFDELCKLKDAKEIRLHPVMLEAFLGDQKPFESFLSIGKRLSDIEIKYSKFLSPQLTVSLIIIQRSIRLLEYVAQIHASLPTLSGVRALDQKIEPLIRELDQQSETLIPEMVLISLGRLIREIYNIHEMGIEFSYL